VKLSCPFCGMCLWPETWPPSQTPFRQEDLPAPCPPCSFYDFSGPILVLPPALLQSVPSEALCPPARRCARRSSPCWPAEVPPLGTRNHGRAGAEAAGGAALTGAAPLNDLEGTTPSSTIIQVLYCTVLYCTVLNSTELY